MTQDDDFNRQMDRLMLIVRVLTVIAACVLVLAVIVLARELLGESPVGR
jgi:hypothetical protein